MNIRQLQTLVVRARRARRAFSLAEVVVALGVVSFAIVAILGVLPSGLQSGKSSQDETRAAQLAQAVLASIASQAPVQFGGIKMDLDDRSTITIDLNGSDSKPLYADQAGKTAAAADTAVYKIEVKTHAAPDGFDPGVANQVTVRVSWPAKAPAADQTTRNFTRIISKF